MIVKMRTLCTSFDLCKIDHASKIYTKGTMKKECLIRANERKVVSKKMICTMAANSVRRIIPVEIF